MTSPDDLTARLEAMLADLDGYIERRAREIADPRIAAVEQAARDRIVEITETTSRQALRDQDLLAEMRRQVAALDKNLGLAWAQLRASGAPIYNGAKDPEGQPSALDPAAQIMYWLGQIMPEWPADQELYGSITCYRGPFGEGRTAVDFEMHPGPSSRGFPAGAFIRALQAVASHDQDATAHDVLVTVRNVLVGNNVPAVAESIADHDRRMKEMDL